MEIEDLLEENDLWDVPDEQREQIEVLELEEYLDNLGYIDISQNELVRDRDAAEILAGIRRFREEYELFYPFVRQHKEQQKYQEAFKCAFPPIDIKTATASELTEEELDFLAHLSSLEGAFELHLFRKGQIKASPILTRVLGFRLSILDLMDEKPSAVYSRTMDNALKNLGAWAGAGAYASRVKLTGDVHQLADTLVNREDYPDSPYAHIAYFKDGKKLLSAQEKDTPGNERRKKRRERRKKRRAKKERERKVEAFKGRFGILPDESKKKYEDTIAQGNYDSLIADRLHRHMCRVVQVKLWLLGTYDGRLDSDIGPVSLEAVAGLVEFIHELQEKVTGESIEDSKSGIFLEDIILELDNDYWAFNVTFLLQQVFPILIDKYRKDVNVGRSANEAEEDIKNATVAEEIYGLAGKVPENEREEFYKELNGIIENDNSNQEHNDNGGKAKRRRKVKTRGGKDLFRSVKLFFKKVKDIIVEGVKKVISAIRELFKWIKNGIKVLVREIKKVFTLFRKAVQFVFGKKIIRTQAARVSITTDYALDFDNTTNLNGLEREALSTHIQKTREITLAMQATADFLGVALYICANITKGPAGWLKMGVRLIKHLARQKFGYRRFSFPVFF